MEEQAKGLREMLGINNTDTQLKELYDSLDAEDKKKKDEFELLKREVTQIHSYLDTFGVPRKNGNKLLSTLERISIALGEKRAYA